MTQDACEKFVGPMPIVQFLSDFIPKANEPRPTNEIDFTLPSASRNEDQFTSPFILIVPPTAREPAVPRLEDGRLWIKNKNSSDDIFRSLTEMQSEDEMDGDLESHVKWTKSSYNVVASYYPTPLPSIVLNFVYSRSLSSFSVTRVDFFGGTVAGDLLRPFDWAKEPTHFSSSCGG
ncbi:hypothetical protein BJV74DRAFT_834732 [Russula compacta]|nr:hypothetical protein BJV74DRAFT_834732 [Russula compacta]